MKALMIMIVVILAGCTTAQQRRNCEITCLDKNETSEDVVRHGCMCKVKADPAKRVHENIDLD